MCVCVCNVLDVSRRVCACALSTVNHIKARIEDRWKMFSELRREDVLPPRAVPPACCVDTLFEL